MDRERVWANAVAYEGFMGRWSGQLAPRFLERFDAPTSGAWLDLGCGTGKLSAAVAARGVRDLFGVDGTEGFVAYASTAVRARFAVGDAQRLPFAAGSFGVVVSGLVLNFIPDIDLALGEIRRVLRPGGVVGGYVWDYARGMQFLRYFWDAAVAVDEAVASRDEGRRPSADAGWLPRIFANAGFTGITAWTVDVPTRFRDFDDYWRPFLDGTGPASATALSFDEGPRKALRERLRATLPIGPDGAIDLVARAHVVRAVRG